MFLEDGRLELDTNTVERAIRPRDDNPQEFCSSPETTTADATGRSLQSLVQSKRN